MVKPNDLVEKLNQVLAEAKGEAISLGVLIKKLAKRGYAALVVLLSLPFCFPIQIPGLSTPFGIALMFIGLRMAFGKRVWLPQWILDKKVPFNVLKKITAGADKVFKKLTLIQPRLLYFVQAPGFLILHGLTITLLAFLMALPLPIPFTNMLSALPLILMGLGILENDGVILLIGYIFAVVCFVFFAAVLWLGQSGLELLIYGST